MNIRIEIPNWLLAISVIFGHILYATGLLFIIICVVRIIDMYITTVINRSNYLGNIISNIDLYHSIIYIVFGLIFFLFGYIFADTNILIRKSSREVEQT